MGQAIGDILPLAVAVAIFPVPIIAVVLMLVSPRGRTNGPAFVLAWVAGLTAVGALALLIMEGADASDEGESATWVNVLLLVLGLVLLVAAVKQWRARPRAGAESPTPGWMRAVDGFTTFRAAGAGFALSALNPKNVLLTVGAVAEISRAGLPNGQSVAALLAFVLVASLGVVTPVVLSFLLGDRSHEPLESLRGWMARNNPVIMAVLFVVIGAKLVGDGISGFAS